MKKILSVLLAMVIIFAALPITAFAQTQESAAAISLNTPINVYVTWSDYTELCFTPNITAQYYMSSQDSNDISFRFFDSNGMDVSQRVYTNDSSSKSKALLTAGESYTIKLNCGQNLLGGDITVVLTKSRVASVEFNDITVIDGRNSRIIKDYNEATEEYDLEWKRYYYSVSGRVTLDDGTTISFEQGWIEIGDEQENVSINDGQAYGSEWEVGNTYTVTGTIFGFSDTFNVTVLQNPIKKLEVSNCQIYEKVNQRKATVEVYDEESQMYKEVEYLQYYYRPDFTVTFQDGTTKTVTDGNTSIEIDGNYVWLSTWDNQWYNNVWGVGKHTATASLYGIETSFEVEVVDCPIETIQAEYNREIFKNINGTLTGDPQYFEYSIEPAYITYTLTYKNGEVFTGDNNEIYSLFEVSPEIAVDQAYGNQWSVGTNYFEVSLGELKGIGTVEVVNSPIATISAKHEDIIKYSGGNFTGDPQYYEYSLDLHNRTEYTLTYKNGDIVICRAWDIYEEFGVFPEITTNQSYDNQWDIGINAFEVSLGALKGTGTVKIIADPNKVTSISARAIKKIYEGTRCSTNWGEYGEYTVYDSFYDFFEYTINYGDGKVFVGRYPDTKFNAQPNITTDQSYENQWGVGKHTVTIDFMGLTCEAEVEIIEFNVESVTAVAEKDLIENWSGYTSWDNDKEYFRYSTNDITYTITYNGGQTFTGKENEISNKFNTSIFEDYTSQNYDNQWKLGENTYKYTFMGINGECKVNVVKTPIESISAVAKRDIMQDIDCSYWEYEDGSIERYYGYCLHNAFDFTITYDGGKKFIGNRTELYNKFGEWISVYAEQLELGENTVEIEFMGATGIAEVNLVECEYKDLEISGENELFITLTKNDNSKITCKAIGFKSGDGGLGGYSGILETTIGDFYGAQISYKVVETEDDAFAFANKDLQLTIGKLKSNKIDNNFIKAVFDFEDIYNSLSQYYLDKNEIFSFNKQSYSSLEALALIACYTNGSIWSGDYNGDYYWLEAEIVNESIKEIFGITADVKTSADYDSQNGKLKLSTKYYENYRYEGKIEFKDGFWLCKQDINENASVIIKLNEDLTVNSINMCDKITHANTEILSEAATCNTDGLILSECELCGEIIEEIIVAKGHNYKVEITEATDTENGKKVYTCENCGHSYTEMIPVIGRHNFIVIKEKAPTCTSLGYTVYKCSVCTETKTEKVDALPHNQKIISKIEASYNELGQILKECTDCGERITEALYAICDFNEDGYVNEEDYELFNAASSDVSVFDFNKNGIVDSFDSDIVKNLTSGIDFEQAADVNGDGGSDMLDLIRLKNILLESGGNISSNEKPDRNIDGNTDSADAMFVRKFLFMSF